MGNEQNQGIPPEPGNGDPAAVPTEGSRELPGGVEGLNPANADMGEHGATTGETTPLPGWPAPAPDDEGDDDTWVMSTQAEEIGDARQAVHAANVEGDTEKAEQEKRAQLLEDLARLGDGSINIEIRTKSTEQLEALDRSLQAQDVHYETTDRGVACISDQPQAESKSSILERNDDVGLTLEAKVDARRMDGPKPTRQEKREGLLQQSYMEMRGLPHSEVAGENGIPGEQAVLAQLRVSPDLAVSTHIPLSLALRIKEAVVNDPSILLEAAEGWVKAKGVPDEVWTSATADVASPVEWGSQLQTHARDNLSQTRPLEWRPIDAHGERLAAQVASQSQETPGTSWLARGAAKLAAAVAGKDKEDVDADENRRAATPTSSEPASARPPTLSAAGGDTVPQRTSGPSVAESASSGATSNEAANESDRLSAEAQEVAQKILSSAVAVDVSINKDLLTPEQQDNLAQTSDGTPAYGEKWDTPEGAVNVSTLPHGVAHENYYRVDDSRSYKSYEDSGEVIRFEYVRIANDDPHAMNMVYEQHRIGAAEHEPPMAAIIVRMPIPEGEAVMQYANEEWDAGNHAMPDILRASSEEVAQERLSLDPQVIDQVMPHLSVSAEQAASATEDADEAEQQLSPEQVQRAEIASVVADAVIGSRAGRSIDNPKITYDDTERQLLNQNGIATLLRDLDNPASTQLVSQGAHHDKKYLKEPEIIQYPGTGTRVEIRQDRKFGEYEVTQVDTDEDGVESRRLFRAGSDEAGTRVIEELRATEATGDPNLVYAMTDAIASDMARGDETLHEKLAGRTPGNEMFRGLIEDALNLVPQKDAANAQAAAERWNAREKERQEQQAQRDQEAENNLPPAERLARLIDKAYGRRVEVRGVGLTSKQIEDLEKSAPTDKEAGRTISPIDGGGVLIRENKHAESINMKHARTIPYDDTNEELEIEYDEKAEIYRFKYADDSQPDKSLQVSLDFSKNDGEALIKLLDDPVMAGKSQVIQAVAQDTLQKFSNSEEIRNKMALQPLAELNEVQSVYAARSPEAQEASRKLVEGAVSEAAAAKKFGIRFQAERSSDVQKLAASLQKDGVQAATVTDYDAERIKDTVAALDQAMSIPKGGFEGKAIDIQGAEAGNKGTRTELTFREYGDKEEIKVEVVEEWVKPGETPDPAKREYVVTYTDNRNATSTTEGVRVSMWVKPETALLIANQVDAFPDNPNLARMLAAGMEEKVAESAGINGEALAIAGARSPFDVVPDAAPYNQSLVPDPSELPPPAEAVKPAGGAGGGKPPTPPPGGGTPTPDPGERKGTPEPAEVKAALDSATALLKNYYRNPLWAPESLERFRADQQLARDAVWALKNGERTPQERDVAQREPMINQLRYALNEENWIMKPEDSEKMLHLAGDGSEEHPGLTWMPTKDWADVKGPNGETLIEAENLNRVTSTDLAISGRVEALRRWGELNQSGGRLNLHTKPEEDAMRETMRRCVWLSEALGAEKAEREAAGLPKDSVLDLSGPPPPDPNALPSGRHNFRTAAEVAAQAAATDTNEDDDDETAEAQRKRALREHLDEIANDPNVDKTTLDELEADRQQLRDDAIKNLVGTDESYNEALRNGASQAELDRLREVWSSNVEDMRLLHGARNALGQRLGEKSDEQQDFDNYIKDLQLDAAKADNEKNGTPVSPGMKYADILKSQQNFYYFDADGNPLKSKYTNMVYERQADQARANYEPMGLLKGFGRRILGRGRELDDHANDAVGNIGDRVKAKAVDLDQRAGMAAERVGDRAKSRVKDWDEQSGMAAERIGDRVKAKAVDLDQRAGMAAERVGDRARELDLHAGQAVGTAGDLMAERIRARLEASRGEPSSNYREYQANRGQYLADLETRAKAEEEARNNTGP